MSARLLALACLTAFPALSAENSNSNHTTIAVYLNSGSSRGPELAVMKREAEALLEAAGFRIDWRDLSRSAPAQTSQLALVDLRGACTADPSPSHAPFRPYLYGRAMGRLLAHELYHVIVKTRAHDSAGVAKPCFSVEDLLGNGLEFEAVTLARLHCDTGASGEDGR
jgi:hypothetical protein